MCTCCVVLSGGNYAVWVLMGGVTAVVLTVGGYSAVGANGRCTVLCGCYNAVGVVLCICHVWCCTILYV